MTSRADARAREQALNAEDVIALTKSLSAQARVLREHGRKMADITKRNRSETNALLASARQLIRSTQTMADQCRNKSSVEKTYE